MMMERVGDRKMEGYCSTGQRQQRAVVPVEEEEESLYSPEGAPQLSKHGKTCVNNPFY
jgi:hypothetical protein